MVSYGIKYFKKETGRFWWKKSQWVWGLFEEGVREVWHPDPIHMFPDHLDYCDEVFSSQDLEEVQLLRDKLINGENYEVVQEERKEGT